MTILTIERIVRSEQTMEVTHKIANQELTEDAPARPHQPALVKSKDHSNPAVHLHLIEIEIGGLKKVVIVDEADPESITKKEKSPVLDTIHEREIIAEMMVALADMRMIDNNIAVVMNIDNRRRNLILKAN